MITFGALNCPLGRDLIGDKKSRPGAHFPKRDGRLARAKVGPHPMGWYHGSFGDGNGKEPMVEKIVRGEQIVV